jgi:Leucine-rich repeat (LRR) protein
LSKQKNPVKRIEFLAKKFDVFDDDDFNKLARNDFHLPNNEQYEQLYEVKGNGQNEVCALYVFNQRLLRNVGVKVPKKIRVADFVFINIVQSDPTEHKEYVQWMLTTFTRLIKESEFEQALMFVNEDLWLASDYLEVFHDNRNKPKFKAMCRHNSAFRGISDPSDINQYRDLSQLFDAVDPFIKKDVSELERDIRIMARLKDGIIPYEDRHVIIFNPLTIKASRLFAKLTNWCTTSSKDTHNNYLRNHKTPNGRKSALYIIIFKTYLLDNSNLNKTDDIYQFHFETAQFMNRKDGRVDDISLLINGNVGLSNYFYNELIKLAKEYKNNKLDNKYVDALIMFGFNNVIFDIQGDNSKQLRFYSYNIPEMVDISRFNNLELLYLVDCKLEKITQSVGSLKKLTMLILTDNKLKSIPKTIAKLSKLKVLNLKGNVIKSLPKELSQLDKSNGGSLEVLSVDNELIEEARVLFPSININQFDNIMSK